MADAPISGLCPPRFAAVREAFEANFAEGPGARRPLRLRHRRRDRGRPDRRLGRPGADPALRERHADLGVLDHQGDRRLHDRPAGRPGEALLRPAGRRDLAAVRRRREGRRHRRAGDVAPGRPARLRGADGGRRLVRLGADLRPAGGDDADVAAGRPAAATTRSPSATWPARSSAGSTAGRWARRCARTSPARSGSTSGSACPTPSTPRCADVRRPPALPDLGEINAFKRAAFLTPWASPGGRSLADWRRAEIPSATGHATAPALARLMGALANGGWLDGVRLLKPETIEAAAAARGPRPGPGAALRPDLGRRLHAQRGPRDLRSGPGERSATPAGAAPAPSPTPSAASPAPM